MDNSMTTTNSFARLLVFYNAVKRSKLNEEGLTKIVNKYMKKPDALMIDLQKKYADVYHFPTEVLLADVQRLEHRYGLPSCLRTLLPSVDDLLQVPVYDERLDIRAAGFDASVALRPSKAGLLLPCAPLPGAPPVRRLDNISKASCLLPGASPRPESCTAAHHDNSKTTVTAIAGSSRIRAKEAEVRALDRIALASSKHKVAPGVLEDSPLALLLTAMQLRRRVRVVIRRVNSIRGTVDGFVRGFDKHFNLLLSDVDETYVLTREGCFPGPAVAEAGRSGRGGAHSSSSSSSTPGHGGLTSQQEDDEPLLVRHLPQLLVRGDNVVLVCFRDK